VEEKRQVEPARVELLRQDALRGERLAHAREAAHAAEVVDAVAELRRGRVEPADRDHELARVVRLDQVVERVVLEDHRQRAVLGQAERLAELGPLREQAAEGDREVVLGRDVDLEVRGAERAVDLAERALEVGAQRFAHPLAADRREAVVLRPVERRRVDELLEERRVAADQVAIAGPEEPQRLLDLGDVGSRRLEHGDVHDRHREVHPGRPRAERERVDDEERPLAEHSVDAEVQELAAVAALLRPAHPVARLAARAGGLVDHGAALG
jgi:hypothetical protein